MSAAQQHSPEREAPTQAEQRAARRAEVERQAPLLVAARRHLGWSQATLAKAAGIPTSAIADVEGFRRPLPGERLAGVVLALRRAGVPAALVAPLAPPDAAPAPAAPRASSYPFLVRRAVCLRTPGAAIRTGHTGPGRIAGSVWSVVQPGPTLRIPAARVPMHLSSLVSAGFLEPADDAARKVIAHLERAQEPVLYVLDAGPKPDDGSCLFVGNRRIPTRAMAWEVEAYLGGAAEVLPGHTAKDPHDIP